MLAMDLTRRARIYMLAPPGAGKGTLSAKLVSRFPSLEAIGSGELLRHHIHQKTDLGKKAESMVAQGGFVDDHLMVELITTQLRAANFLGIAGKGRSFILDGFPRTLPQARMLNDMLRQNNAPLNFVVNLIVPRDAIMQRIEQRWVHSPSGRVYNLTYNKPKNDGVDNITGEALTKRPDDNPHTYQKRLDVYEKSTSPLRDYYDKLGILWTVSGDTSAIIWPQLEAETLARFK